MARSVRRELPIYLEVSPLLTRHLTGIGRFVARLVEALVRLRPVRLVNTIQGQHARNMRLSNSLVCGQEVEVTGSDVPPADAELDAWVRRLFQRRHVRHDAGLARRCAIVYTMLRPAERHFRKEFCLFYDFTAVLLPQAHVRETQEHFGRLFTRAAPLCDKLLAISHSTKADARWLCPVPPDDVVVGYPGPSLCLRSHQHPLPVPRSHKIILVVSTHEPRKNGKFLLDWFFNSPVLAADAELWWAGPKGWLCDFSKRRSHAAGALRSVRFLGMVPDRQLCELYQQAALTVYPSLYEGFGFPVLDALRHGAPVLCSFNSSLQEFAGPGVFYFDPCNPASLDEAYREYRASAPFATKRDDLDSRFSWDALARKVVSLSDSQ
jgi:glycosyltransferase involved in cell wall biosynthesis